MYNVFVSDTDCHTNYMQGCRLSESQMLYNLNDKLHPQMQEFPAKCDSVDSPVIWDLHVWIQFWHCHHFLVTEIFFLCFSEKQKWQIQSTFQPPKKVNYFRLS